MPVAALLDAVPALPDEDDFWIAPTAYVIGNVSLGSEVGVWFGATLRGDNEPMRIGDRTNLQENVVLHSDPGWPLTLGKDVTVGHGAILHGCTIADNVIIGMGATILNGAKIGNNSIVGANALVTEGKSFPDNSLIVGAPAKAVRNLTAEEVVGIAESSHGYVRNWRRFKAGLSSG